MAKVYDTLKIGLKHLLGKLLYSSSNTLSHASVVKTYLKGSGIEIGALHRPLQVPDSINVKYVDRMSAVELRQQYPELANENLVDVDVIDNGETLQSIADASQDFVIAHQFLEHCQNPLQAISNMLRVLKPSGILYLSIPDKRHTFDLHRPTTPIEHLLRDYHDGPEWSKKEHFQEWAAFINLGYKNHSESEGDPRVEIERDRLLAMDYSIHYHVWTQTEILELILMLKQKLDFSFEVEFFLQSAADILLVLRKP